MPVWGLRYERYKDRRGWASSPCPAFLPFGRRFNLVVRWDYLSKATEEFGRHSNCDIQTGALILAAGAGDALANQNYKKFTPRVEFAYDLTGPARL